MSVMTAESHSDTRSTTLSREILTAALDFCLAALLNKAQARCATRILGSADVS
jgi:hypothetical protein